MDVTKLYTHILTHISQIITLAQIPQNPPFARWQWYFPTEVNSVRKQRDGVLLTISRGRCTGVDGGFFGNYIRIHVRGP